MHLYRKSLEKPLYLFCIINDIFATVMCCFADDDRTQQFVECNCVRCDCLMCSTVHIKFQSAVFGLPECNTLQVFILHDYMTSSSTNRDIFIVMMIIIPTAQAFVVIWYSATYLACCARTLVPAVQRGVKWFSVLRALDGAFIQFYIKQLSFIVLITPRDWRTSAFCIYSYTTLYLYICLYIYMFYEIKIKTIKKNTQVRKLHWSRTDVMQVAAIGLVVGTYWCHQ